MLSEEREWAEGDLSELRRLEKLKKSKAKRHGTFFSAALLRHSKLGAAQHDVVHTFCMKHEAAAVAALQPGAVESKQAWLRQVLPPCAIEEALQALEFVGPVATQHASHFADHFAAMIRWANEEYPDWSIDWKSSFVTAGCEDCYVKHCEGSDHSGCRRFIPWARCDLGDAFHFATHTPWRNFAAGAAGTTAYPPGVGMWLRLLFKSWAFNKYTQRRISDYARSSTPESVFGSLRIMVPKWQHTTDQGMREGGAAVVLDHNEGRRDKLLTACVEIGKYHKGKGIGVKRQRRPKEYKWKAETLAELLHDVPQMQRLARARLRFHAAAKVRRRDFVVDRRARHAAGELQPTASIPIPFLEPRAGLSLGLGMDGFLINTVDLEAGNEFVRQVPPSPFTVVDLVRRRAEVEPVSQRNGFIS